MIEHSVDEIPKQMIRSSNKYVRFLFLLFSYDVHKKGPAFRYSYFTQYLQFLLFLLMKKKTNV